MSSWFWDKKKGKDDGDLEAGGTTRVVPSTSKAVELEMESRPREDSLGHGLVSSLTSFAFPSLSGPETVEEKAARHARRGGCLECAGTGRLYCCNEDLDRTCELIGHHISIACVCLIAGATFVVVIMVFILVFVFN